MKTVVYEKFKVVIPEEGYCFYNRNDNVHSDELTMPLSANLSCWEELTLEEVQTLEDELNNLEN